MFFFLSMILPLAACRPRLICIEKRVNKITHIWIHILKVDRSVCLRTSSLFVHDDISMLPLKFYFYSVFKTSAVFFFLEHGMPLATCRRRVIPYRKVCRWTKCTKDVIVQNVKKNKQTKNISPDLTQLDVLLWANSSHKRLRSNQQQDYDSRTVLI